MVNRYTGMAPYDARKAKGLFGVKHHLELHAKHDRLYPNIDIGDKVNIYTKKKRFDTNIRAPGLLSIIISITLSRSMDR